MFILMIVSVVSIAPGLMAMDLFSCLWQNAPSRNIQDLTSAALLWAAQNGRIDECKQLIDAARLGHEEICNLLIEAGAHINAQDEYGFTGLMYAAHENHKEICKLLIANRADINTRKKDGETALSVAVRTGHIKICELLIANGADIHIQDNSNATPLEIAAARHHREIAELLINAMLKLTPQERSEITTLLSLKRKNVPGLHSESKKLITQTHLDDIKRAKRQRAYEEIMKIPSQDYDAEKKVFLEYLRNIR